MKKDFLFLQFFTHIKSCCCVHWLNIRCKRIAKENCFIKEMGNKLLNNNNFVFQTKMQWKYSRLREWIEKLRAQVYKRQPLYYIAPNIISNILRHLNVWFLYTVPQTAYVSASTGAGHSVCTQKKEYINSYKYFGKYFSLFIQKRVFNWEYVEKTKSLFKTYDNKKNFKMNYENKFPINLIKKYFPTNSWRIHTITTYGLKMLQILAIIWNGRPRSLRGVLGRELKDSNAR